MTCRHCLASAWLILQSVADLRYRKSRRLKNVTFTPETESPPPAPTAYSKVSAGSACLRALTPEDVLIQVIACNCQN